MSEEEQLLFVREDAEGFQDFRDVLSDYAPQIEKLASQLSQNPRSPELIGDLFRLVHTIKGDAGLCRVMFVVPFAHALEGLLARLRSGELVYQEVMGDVLLLVLDRLDLVMAQVAGARKVDVAQMHNLLDALCSLESAPLPSVLATCSRLIAAMVGAQGSSDAPVAAAAGKSVAQSRQQDMLLFRTLAFQLEQRMPEFVGRTERNLRLALELNRQAGGWVDAEQLEAAVYMHDVGMMFLPEQVWLKLGSISENERRLMVLHPAWVAGLMGRMPGWEGAALMVMQHHETPDGEGYPYGLASGEICQGARILALVDAFEAVMLKHAHRGQRRSMLRAAAELNAADDQFERAWLDPFNQVLRRMLEQAAS
ncbi:HD domain-containing phosphohydrolase [Aquitalea sp.]|jgi:HD-GYP domain-containing protein (c-di-GMP phosphodiesterase class II)|uniref:HD-GYP domain-containing protein n=1 Tax=Aquitalea sp. TaxID=1872623 RepID=UPI002586D800|nr:HD domain-containing phosphohydrolase [Aquitalea sp.]